MEVSRELSGGILSNLSGELRPDSPCLAWLWPVHLLKLTRNRQYLIRPPLSRFPKLSPRHAQRSAQEAKPERPRSRRRQQRKRKTRRLLNRTRLRVRRVPAPSLKRRHLQRRKLNQQALSGITADSWMLATCSISTTRRIGSFAVAARHGTLIDRR